MSNVTVIGSQWGDEGKGKIVDWLSNRADLVVRFQGGHNAGHTLVVNNITYKLSLLPSGVVRGIKSIIGNGVVIDPWALIEEINRLRKQGVNINKNILTISDTATLILPYHKDLDMGRENSLTGIKIGTTGRGIGPAYEDKVGRRSIRVCDLYDTAMLQNKLKNALSHHNPLRSGLGIKKVDSEDLINKLLKISKLIKPFTNSSWRELSKAIIKRKKILFEGAQGVMLDIDHGTYPFVTSSNTISAQSSIGSGVGNIKSCYTLGITKSYLTRVGEGPFPSEQKNKIGQKLGEIGNEFGTVTGRKRRCGWLDTVMLKKSVIVSGMEGIALTKLDVLDTFKKIKICTSYKYHGKMIKYMPSNLNNNTNLIPVYEECSGWEKNTKGIRDWNELPINAKKYIKRIEKLVGIPITIISTSPEREDTILFRNPFEED